MWGGRKSISQKSQTDLPAGKEDMRGPQPEDHRKHQSRQKKGALGVEEGVLGSWERGPNCQLKCSKGRRGAGLPMMCCRWYHLEVINSYSSFFGGDTILLVVPGGSDFHSYSSSGKLPRTRHSVPGLGRPFQVPGVI